MPRHRYWCRAHLADWLARSGDGWRVGNVDAVYAAAGAVRLARIAPKPQSLKLVTEST